MVSVSEKVNCLWRSKGSIIITQCVINVKMIYDNGIVYCKKCLEKKKKLQQRKRQTDENKPLDDIRKSLGDYLISQKPIVWGGEVSIHKCHS